MTHTRGEHSADGWSSPERTWRLSEFDIFQDLAPEDMDRIARSAPMREVPAGTLLISPDQPGEILFILKRGRVRLYRLAFDGRTLTTAIVEAGQIFGEMVLLGQRLDDTYAEALDASVVCLMSRDDVYRLLLSDARIAARIAESLGARVADLERRLGDTVLKSVPARITSALAALSGTDHTDIRLTHAQLADLVGTTRETMTKVLGDLRDRDLVSMRRGRIRVKDAARLGALCDDTSLAPVTGGHIPRNDNQASR